MHLGAELSWLGELSDRTLPLTLPLTRPQPLPLPLFLPPPLPPAPPPPPNPLNPNPNPNPIPNQGELSDLVREIITRRQQRAVLHKLEVQTPRQPKP